MRRKALKRLLCMGCVLLAVLPLQACSSKKDTSVTEIEIVQYKPEASNYFQMVEDAFNEAHDDIHLTISSPNDAAAILRTRFIREDYPDIVGIGGDIEYSYYVDAGILADVSDYEGLSEIKEVYREIDESLELVPTEESFGLRIGMNCYPSVTKLRQREYCRSTLVSRIHGPVWRRGMPSPWI